MARLKPNFFSEHPVRAGMMWALGFAVLFPLAMALMGRPLHGRIVWVVFLLTTVVGGLGWGYSMKRRFDQKAGEQ